MDRRTDGQMDGKKDGHMNRTAGQIDGQKMDREPDFFYAREWNEWLFL